MYIVTGGAGFIGSAMVWKLNTMGIEDILIVDNLGSGIKWKNLVNLRYTDYLHKSIFYSRLLQDKLPESVKAVFHLGACSSTTEKDADYLMENNFHFTRDLCLWAMDNHVRFINASSAATYGDGTKGFDDSLETMRTLQPMNMYGYSKQLFDLWAHSNKWMDRIASLKFFNVFGPNEYHKGDMMSVICKAYSQIKETGELGLFKSYRDDYPDGGQQRDFVYVKDCVDVMFWLMEHPEANGIFNVGTGRARSWNDLADAVFSAMGLERKVNYIPMPESIRDSYQYFTEARMQRLTDAGYPNAFTSLEDAVRDYVTAYLAGNDPYLLP